MKPLLELSQPHKLLSYTKADIADHLVSNDYNAATESLGLADFYRSSGDLISRELDGRKVTPDDKIRVGQHLRELALKIGKPLDGDGFAIEEGEENPANETFDERLDRKFPGGPLPAGMTLIESDGSVSNA